MNLFVAVLTALSMQVIAQDNDSFLVTEARTSAPFSYISIQGGLNVKIVQDNLPGVTVRGTKFQVGNTVTWLRNDTLFVFQNNIRRQDGRTSLTISVENISLIEVNGNTRVDCTGLINTDLLTVRALNGAQIKLDVRALKVDSKVTGCGTIDISGIAASNEENVEGCGVIDTHMLDVMDQRNGQVNSCMGC